MVTTYKYMKAICTQRSMSGAAKELGVTQPALSAFVKRHEAYVGHALFDRSTIPLKLTKAGKAYMEYLDSCMKLKQEFENKVNDQKC